jgi:serine/threonine protein kinase
VKLFDVGLSRLVPLEALRADWDALHRTTAPEAAGARAIPYYLSPERARSGESVEVASDLFVATVLFYEALTAERPFDASTFDGIVEIIANARPPRISDRRPDVPQDLDALIHRALASQPHVRPPSARELQEELRAVFDGRRGSAAMRAAPVVAVPPPPPTVGAASIIDSSAHTPRDVRPPSHPPETFVTRSEVIDGFYEDETRTDNNVEDITNHAARAPRHDDESSADAPHRTQRPPSAYDIVVDEAPIEEPPVEHAPVQDEPHTSPGEQLEAAMRALREDEETETMELTAELRARIEAMARAKAAPPPASTAESSKPPPTRRVR